MNSADTPSLLQVTDVTKAYGPDTPPVLQGVCMNMAPGETLAITGPSGSGKSTLLNIIGTLDRPNSGAVLLNGIDVTALDQDQLAQLRNKELGFVFQDHHLLPQCTALENVLIPTLADGRASSQARRRALELLDAVGLSDRAQYFPDQLSGGQRQRVAAVRALIQQPKLLLADEPTGSLDQAAAAAMGDLLVELNREQGVALIVVTHWPELARKMDRVLRLSDGRLLEDGDKS